MTGTSMPKSLLILMLLMLAGAPALGQDAEPAGEVDDAAAATSRDDADAPGADEAADGSEAAEDGPAIDLDDPEFADLDQQTYEEDDDDFVPTEEIPADEAIPFPSDI
jgi:hypothetical protein